MILPGTHYSLEVEKEKEAGYTTILIFLKVWHILFPFICSLLLFIFLKVSIVVFLMTPFWY